MSIHPTAIIDPTARVDESANVGAYAIVEADSHIGPDVRLHHHAVVGRWTTLDRGVQVYPFAVVGYDPQDTAWKGTRGFLRVGEETVIREHAELHRGTEPDSETVVGKRCFLMTHTHVAHNCVVGDDVVLVTGAALAGHVRLGDRVVMGGGAMAHQFVCIGRNVMIRGLESVPHDCPPFMTIAKESVIGPNAIGLRRAGFTREARSEIRTIYRGVFRCGKPLPLAIREFCQSYVPVSDAGRELIAFLTADRKRRIVHYQPPPRPRHDDDN